MPAVILPKKRLYVATNPHQRGAMPDARHGCVGIGIDDRSKGNAYLRPHTVDCKRGQGTVSTTIGTTEKLQLITGVTLCGTSTFTFN
jgi:hypothetical protein